MKIEHIGICVEHPMKIAEWWIENLGFKILRKMGEDIRGAIFIEDDNGFTLEIFRLEEVNRINFEKIDFIQLHFAIECDDTIEEAKRLERKGAKIIGESLFNSYLHERIIVSDPWGICIQLVNRKDKLK